MKASLVLVPLLATLGLATAASAETLLLLDHSGSMAGQVEGGSSKSRVAIDAIRNRFVPGLPRGERAALWVFGGLCRTVRGTGSWHREASKIDSELGRLGGPSGSTPLAWAVQEALGELLSGDSPRHMIVVTDGVDTCGGDPCAILRRARQSGAEITVHTVGLGMRPDSGEFRTLQCMADATDGIAQAVDPADVAAETLAFMERVSEDIASRARGEILVEVVDPKGDRRIGVPYAAREDGGGAEFRGESGVPLAVPPGRYRIDNGAGVSGEIDVVPGDTSRLEVRSELGQLTLRAGCARGLSYVVIDDGGSTVASGVLVGTTDLLLPPGDYGVTLTRFPYVPPAPVTVERNRSQELVLGTIGSLLVDTTGTNGRSADLPIEVYDDQTAGDRPVATGESNHSFSLPAGTYNVRVSADHPEKELYRSAANVRVEPCSEARTELEMRSVLVLCGGRGGAEIWSDAGAREPVLVPAGATIPISPGIYNFRFDDGSLLTNVRIGNGVSRVGCSP